jgi:hypothetical protein
MAAQGADPAFGDRVGSRRPGRRLDDADVGHVEHGVEGAGELGVAVSDEEAELFGAVAEVHQKVACLLSDPWSGGVGR